jgi:hypothetical protein
VTWERRRLQELRSAHGETVAGGTWEWGYHNGATGVAAGTGGLLFFAPLLMILFRQKYPRWWFDWNLVKWLLAIPHYIVLFFLDIGALVVVIAAWFAILFTGRYPRGMFDFVEGLARWHNRVIGYAVTLVTDEYPSFRLAP